MKLFSAQRVCERKGARGVSSGIHGAKRTAEIREGIDGLRWVDLPRRLVVVTVCRPGNFSDKLQTHSRLVMVLLFCEPGCKLRVLRGPGARGGQNHGGRQGAYHGRWVAILTWHHVWWINNILFAVSHWEILTLRIIIYFIISKWASLVYVPGQLGFRWNIWHFNRHRARGCV